MLGGLSVAVGVAIYMQQPPPSPPFALDMGVTREQSLSMSPAQREAAMNLRRESEQRLADFVRSDAYRSAQAQQFRSGLRVSFLVVSLVGLGLLVPIKPLGLAFVVAPIAVLAVLLLAPW
jgi:hypothetical protein